MALDLKQPRNIYPKYHASSFPRNRIGLPFHSSLNNPSDKYRQSRRYNMPEKPFGMRINNFQSNYRDQNEFNGFQPPFMNHGTDYLASGAEARNGSLISSEKKQNYLQYYGNNIMQSANTQNNPYEGFGFLSKGPGKSQLNSLRKVLTSKSPFNKDLRYTWNKNIYRNTKPNTYGGVYDFFPFPNNRNYSANFPIETVDYPHTERLGVKCSRYLKESESVPQRSCSRRQVNQTRAKSSSLMKGRYWNSMNFSVGILPHLEKGDSSKKYRTLNTTR